MRSDLFIVTVVSSVLSYLLGRHSALTSSDSASPSVHDNKLSNDWPRRLLSDDRPTTTINDAYTTVVEAFKRSSATKNAHCYSFMYAEVFAHLDSSQPRPLELLEIGIDATNSLTLWKAALGNGVHVHGVDNGKKHGVETLKKQQLRMEEENVTIHMGDQGDMEFLSQLKNATPSGFDVIIDDGGHTNKQQIASLKALWGHVRPGGVYVIEDLETQYYSGRGFGCYGLECGGGKLGKPDTSIALLKSIIDVLNRDFHNGPNQYTSQFNIGHGTFSVVPGDASVRSLSCYRNLCAIFKRRGDEFIEGIKGGCMKHPNINAGVSPKHGLKHGHRRE